MRRQHTGILLLDLEELVDLLTDLAIGHAAVVLLATILVDQVQETVIDVNLQYVSPTFLLNPTEQPTHELVLHALDNRDVHVVRRRAKFLELLAREDIRRDQVNLLSSVMHPRPVVPFKCMEYQLVSRLLSWV